MFSIQGYYYKNNKQEKIIEGLQNTSYQRDDDQKYIWCINENNQLALRDEVNGKNWVNITNDMKSITSSGIGNIWTISTDDQVYKCNKDCATANLEQPDKNIRLKQINSKGEYVWGVDQDGHVHKAPNDGSMPFTKATQFTNVSASNDFGSFYGVNTQSEIYKCTQIKGNVKQLDADEKELWGTDSGNNVYKCNIPCQGNWEKMGEKIKYVSAASGKNYNWAIAEDNTVLKCRKPCRGTWESVDGRIKDIG
tara:strand:+ start:534 stop:1286 length:753 start_codon:yes stop_codon:yes gene_type:complete